MIPYYCDPYMEIMRLARRRAKATIAHQQTCPVCGRTLVNLYRRDKEWKCKKCWDKEDSLPSLKEMAEVILGHERACDACSYKHYGCSGGISGGPNGPIYPPCAEHDPTWYMDEDRIVKVYDEIMEEGDAE